MKDPDPLNSSKTSLDAFDPVDNHTLAAIESITAALFKNAKGSHDWEHTRRVVSLSKTIGQAEKAEMDVVIAGALLHDIGRCNPEDTKGKDCHARKGETMAGDILKQFPMTDEKKAAICHCVAAHRFRRPPDPETLEAKVVFDADKLDAIGAVGVARAYLFAGELGAKLHNPDVDVTTVAAYSREDTGYREYVVKLQYIKERMQTACGRRMAEDRHTFMETFFQRFLSEYAGGV
ncbi:MAG: HD domain-containing protein [Thermodesulfobacteriota bacterium]|nr:HD domain-containing protein [Thermodesulfobacteriota bacterium]